MPRKKQKFIDKKNAVSFRLVHRSQHDPLAAADDVGQHVLLPLEQENVPRLTKEDRRKELVKFGVYYEDDYDYLQHMKTVDEYHNVQLNLEEPNVSSSLPTDDDDPEGRRLFRKTPRGLVPIVSDDIEHNTTSSKLLSSAPTGTGDQSIQLPSSVFASQAETDVGLVHRGVDTAKSGPLIGWDPDVVAALDDDFDVDDPDNLLDDNFVFRANAEGEDDSDADSEDWTDDSADDNESDEEVHRLGHRLGQTRLEIVDSTNSTAHPNSGAEVGDFKAKIEAMKLSMAMKAMERMGSEDGDWPDDELEQVETKSRFTEYSMTSSVIRRNDQLTLLDDRFERLYEEYDDDLIGGLDGEEIGGNMPVKPAGEDADASTVAFDAMLREFETQNAKPTAHQVLEKLRDLEALRPEEDDENDEKLVKIAFQDRTDAEQKWDCESIISTYSNLYNHPKTISEDSQKKQKANVTKITLSNKSGLPLGVLPEFGPTQRQLEAMEMESGRADPAPPPPRRPDETAEEKRNRKKAVKEERRNRREERKANTSAFKDEEKRQKKMMIDLKNNVQGMKIL